MLVSERRLHINVLACSRSFEFHEIFTSARFHYLHQFICRTTSKVYLRKSHKAEVTIIIGWQYSFSFDLCTLMCTNEKQGDETLPWKLHWRQLSILRSRSLFVTGHGAWERICWALMWTLAFLEYPRYNSGTVLRHKHERQRPISQKTRKLFGPEGKFQKQNLLIVPQFLAHKPIKIASFTDGFIVLFSKLLKLWSWMQTQQTQNSFRDPKSYRDFRETVARSLCAHRFRSVAVHCFVLAAKLLFKMESDRVKWSNYVHGYISRVLAQCVNTTPFFSDLPQLTY